MPRQVFAHIGLPKTGTTYLQALMYANRDSFAAQGVTVSGTHALHYSAASELAGKRPRRARRLPEGAFERVRRQVGAARTDRVLFSNERYSLLTSPGAGRFAEGFADAELHLLVTVRDLVAAEPSAWQEYVKNGGTLGWLDFCADGLADPERLRNRRRVRRVLEVWPELIAPERIHVVTVPPPGSPRELILERFCGVLGVDPHRLDTLEPPRQNTSLDYPSTELIRLLNGHRPGLSVRVQRDEVKQYLANGVLSRRSGTVRPVLAGEARDLARSENAWARERLATGGFDVVGDLADLEEREADPVDPAAYDADPAEVLDTALEALVLLARRSHRRGRRLRDLRRRSGRAVVRRGGARLRDRVRDLLGRRRGRAGG